MTDERGFEDLSIRSLVCWTILLCFILGIAFGFTKDILKIKIGENLESAIFELVSYGAALLWIITKFKKLNLDLNCMIGKYPSEYKWWYYVVIVITLMFFSIGAFYIQYYIISLFNPGYVEGILNEKDILTSRDSNFFVLYNLLNFIIIVIVAPIVEELVFRGVFLHRLTVKWNIRKAILISSLIFGFLHHDVLGAFTFAVVMSILYIKWKSIKVCIICHMINNFLAAGTGLIAAFINNNTSVQTIAQFHSEVLGGVICFILTVPFISYYICINIYRENLSLPYFYEENRNSISV